MADVTLYGPDYSSYVWSARMICAEKGVSAALAPIDLGSPAHAALHPFRKVPVLVHGAAAVWETEAIGRYVDRAFDGPALQPGEPLALARMDGWLSAIVDYLYPTLVKRVVIPRLVVEPDGRPVDPADIAAAAATGTGYWDAVEAALADRPYLAGSALSLADLVLAPIVAYVARTPEGESLFAPRPALARWFGAVSARESFAACAPRPPGSAETTAA